jgi:hypothetical protein
MEDGHSNSGSGSGGSTLKAYPRPHRKGYYPYRTPCWPRVSHYFQTQCKGNGRETSDRYLSQQHSSLANSLVE